MRIFATAALALAMAADAAANRRVTTIGTYEDAWDNPNNVPSISSYPVRSTKCKESGEDTKTSINRLTSIHSSPSLSNNSCHNTRLDQSYSGKYIYLRRANFTLEIDLIRPNAYILSLRSYFPNTGGILTDDCGTEACGPLNWGLIGGASADCAPSSTQQTPIGASILLLRPCRRMVCPFVVCALCETDDLPIAFADTTQT